MSVGARLRWPVARVLRRSSLYQLYRARDRMDRIAGPLPGIHNEWTLFRGDEPTPSDELVTLALRAIEDARHRVLSAVDIVDDPDESVVRWPGAHYRLLPALAVAHRARSIVEVGTYRGASAVAFLDAACVERVVSYDVVPWDRFGPTFLSADVVAAGRFEQRIGDLADPAYFATQASTLADADLVLVDGPKDSRFEPAFLPQLLALAPTRRQLLVIDDIRMLNLVQPWHDLPYDKIDLTSFGHFTGTGVAMREPSATAPPLG